MQGEVVGRGSVRRRHAAIVPDTSDMAVPDLPHAYDVEIVGLVASPGHRYDGRPDPAWQHDRDRVDQALDDPWDRSS